MNQINIFCSHFPACSGCSINKNIANMATYHEAVSFFSDLGVKDFKLHTGKPCGWRCRAKLAVRGSPAKPLIGLFKAGSHDVVDIPHCQVHHPLINEAVAVLRKWISANGVVPYDEKSGKGTLRYIELTVDRIHQRVQLVLVLNYRNPDPGWSINETIKSLWEENPLLWHSLWLNFNERRDNVISGEVWKRIFGEEWLWDCYCGRMVCFHPASFAQANPEMFERLLLELSTHVPQGTNIVEFYAGGGVIGLTQVEKCQSLCCNEIVPLAELCFNETCAQLPQELKNKARFVCGSADGLAGLINENTDIVIVDPPRKGIDAKLLSGLCAPSGVKRLIYVSCGWKSFKVNCKKLLENDWILISACSFLFFPGSDHLEILAIFDRHPL